jgi:hypothetical protein
MVEKPSKLQPALLGGLVLGLGQSYRLYRTVIFAVADGNSRRRPGGVLVDQEIAGVANHQGRWGLGRYAVGFVGALIYLIIGVPFSLLQWNGVVAQMEQRATT